jgi:phospholipase A1
VKARVLLALAFLGAAAAARADDAPVSPWERRAEQEQKWRAEGLPLIPHRTNYFFPFTYNTSPHPTSATKAESVEAKFQFSVKVLLWNDIAHSDLDLYFAYTQLSMWEIYNRSQSAPFRDTNHEPEVFVSWPTTQPLWGATLRRVDVGLDHQSNGVNRPDSRSWNRAFAQALYDWDNFAFTVRPWIRLPDTDGNDDNPDIEKYMGYGEFTVEYFRRNHLLSVMVRDNMRFRNRGAVRMDYTFPMTRNLTGLVQWFNGYGESLIDYNRPDNRFSIGLALGSLGGS